MHKLLKRLLGGRQALFVVILVAGVGMYLMARSLGASYPITVEPEKGTSSGAVVRCSDSSASGGSKVRFGRTSCTDTPIPQGQLIGWGNISIGPGGAWHRMAKLKDGSWLRVLTIFPSANKSDLAIFRSTDHARTWTRVATVGDGTRLVDNGFLHQTPNGDILLGGRNLIVGSSYKMSQWRSTNGGVSWTRETDLANSSGSRGHWEPFYYNLPNGRVVVMWADETWPGFSQVLVERASWDNGKTWTAKQVVVEDGAAGRPGMAGVTYMWEIGEYLFVYEICGTRACDVFYKKSRDGVTWPGGIGTRIPGQRCGPFVTSLSDGRVVVTSCRVNDSNWATPVSWSDNYGVTWNSNSSPFTDAGIYGSWPAVYQIGPNELGFVSGHRIRFGTFKPLP